MVAVAADFFLFGDGKVSESVARLVGMREVRCLVVWFTVDGERAS